MNYTIYTLLSITLLSYLPCYGQNASELTHSQFEAEQGVIDAFLASVEALYALKSPKLHTKYPLGHRDKKHALSWAKRLPLRYIDNIYAVNHNRQLHVIVRFNAQPYTSPILQDSFVTIVAMHETKPLLLGKHSSDMVNLTSWRCLDGVDRFKLNSSSLAQCALQAQ